jgi:hypothetical protein
MKKIFFVFGFISLVLAVNGQHAANDTIHYPAEQMPKKV